MLLVKPDSSIWTGTLGLLLQEQRPPRMLLGDRRAGSVGLASTAFQIRPGSLAGLDYETPCSG